MRSTRTARTRIARLYQGRGSPIRYAAPLTNAPERMALPRAARSASSASASEDGTSRRRRPGTRLVFGKASGSGSPQGWWSRSVGSRTRTGRSSGDRTSRHHPANLRRSRRWGETGRHSPVVSSLAPFRLPVYGVNRASDGDRRRGRMRRCGVDPTMRHGVLFSRLPTRPHWRPSTRNCSDGGPARTIPSGPLWSRRTGLRTWPFRRRPSMCGLSGRRSKDANR